MKIWSELRRRNVLRMGALYVVAAVLVFAWLTWWQEGPTDKSIAVLAFDIMSDDVKNHHGRRPARPAPAGHLGLSSIIPYEEPA